MKKQFLLLTLFTAFSAAAVAQQNIHKGSLLLGGDISVGASSTKQGSSESGTQNFQFSPVYGRAVKDNFFLGSYLRLNVGNTKNKNFPGVFSTRAMEWAAGVFVRRYKPLTNGFLIFLQADAGGSTGRVKEKSGTGADYITTQKQTGLHLNLTPGFAYTITRKLQVETGLRSIAAIGYNRLKERNPASGTFDRVSNRFSFSSSLNNFTSQLYLGFRVLLNK